MPPRALITGITGQDGAYLARFLLDKGYEVHGVVRARTTSPFERLVPIQDRLHLYPCNLLDQLSLVSLLERVQPSEVYNLAAQTFVPASFAEPLATAEFTGFGVQRILEAIRLTNPKIRFFQASSSDMFGQAREEPQTEETPLSPRSPYGVAKAYGHWTTINYREVYGLFAVSGILFNHESPLRGVPFVTRKVSDGVARIKLGLQQTLLTGNLDARRDWGFAGDYVEAMWLMLAQDQPNDFIIATGVTHSVRELVETAFARVGLDWRAFVETDPALARPSDVSPLRGDATKARQLLGWQPRVSFKELVEMMVDADLERVQREAASQ
jgi:GDPmannose 4,6-dehydratase